MFISHVVPNDLMGKDHAQIQVATFAMSLLTLRTIWRKSTSYRGRDSQQLREQRVGSAQKVALRP